MANAGQTGTTLEEVLEVEEHCMARLADSFESSARRWELVVYPSMIAFILLAAYGFYLIYNLTHDIADVAKSVREMTASVTQDLGSISSKMSNIAVSTAYMRPMSRDIHSMTANVDDMATSTNHMQYNMWQLNRNVSAPFNMMDKMTPFGSSRPYGRQSSQIAPPLYPRMPTRYYQPRAIPQYTATQQPAMAVTSESQIPAETSPTASNNKTDNLNI